VCELLIDGAFDTLKRLLLINGHIIDYVSTGQNVVLIKHNICTSADIAIVIYVGNVDDCRSH